MTVNADGTFSYTPNAEFNGADSFTFKANDGSDDSNIATVSPDRGPRSTMLRSRRTAAPAATKTHRSTARWPQPMWTAQSLSFSLVDERRARQRDGQCATARSATHPNANSTAQESFTFKANDGSDDSNIATVSLTVNSVDDPDNDCW